VGPSAPDPIELVLTPGDKIAGTLVIEVDAKQPPNPNPRHVMLNPAGNPIFGAPPQAEVKSDSTFIFDSVLPGRWRVEVDGPGYVKSVALGDKEVSGDEIEITVTGGPLRIVMGTKFAQRFAASGKPRPAERRGMGSNLPRPPGLCIRSPGYGPSKPASRAISYLCLDDGSAADVVSEPRAVQGHGEPL